MTESAWSVFAFSGVAALALCFLLGVFVVDFYVRVAWRRDRPLFRRWGVEDGIFAVVSHRKFALYFVALGMLAALFSYVSVAMSLFVFGGLQSFDTDSVYFDRSISVLYTFLIAGDASG